MKVFLLLTCLQLVTSASIRPQAEEAASVEVEEKAEPAAAAAGHSHEDHHLEEEPHAPHHMVPESRIVRNQTADGTGVYNRLDQSYEAIHHKERRSPIDQIPMEQVSLNCREVVAVGVRDPYTCAKLGQGQLPGDASTYGVAVDSAGQVIGYDGKVIFADPSGSFSSPTGLDMAKAPGRCRFDPYKAQVNPSTACLCVATSATCTQNRDGCYWFVDKKTGNKECISNAERFYDLLYMLLQKRGKKDFAINIRYGGTPARGSLPYGPMGPQIIGQGNPTPSYLMNLDGTASPAPVDPASATGLPFSYGSPLDGLPPSTPTPPSSPFGSYGMLPPPAQSPYGLLPALQPGLPGLMGPLGYTGGLGYGALATNPFLGGAGYSLPLPSTSSY